MNTKTVKTRLPAAMALAQDARKSPSCVSTVKMPRSAPKGKLTEKLNPKTSEVVDLKDDSVINAPKLIPSKNF